MLVYWRGMQQVLAWVVEVLLMVAEMMRRLMRKVTQRWIPAMRPGAVSSELCHALLLQLPL
jgi:hypothetical protein